MLIHNKDPMIFAKSASRFLLFFIAGLCSLNSAGQELPRGVYGDCLSAVVSDGKLGNKGLHKAKLAVLDKYKVSYYADREIRYLLDPTSATYDVRNERLVNSFYIDLAKQNPEIETGMVFDNLEENRVQNSSPVYLPKNLKCRNSDEKLFSVAEINTLMNKADTLYGQDRVVSEVLKSIVRIFAKQYYNSLGGSKFKNGTANLSVVRDLDYISIEHEYWRTSDESAAFQSHLILLKGIRSLICMLDLDVKLEVYNTLRTLVGYSKEDQASLIDPYADRILMSMYFRSPNSTLDRYCNYIEAWGQNDVPSNIWPVFNSSNEGESMYDCYNVEQTRKTVFQGFHTDLLAKSLIDVEQEFMNSYEQAKRNGFTINSSGSSKCGSPSFPHWTAGDVSINGFVWLDLRDLEANNYSLGSYTEPNIVDEPITEEPLVKEVEQVEEDEREDSEDEFTPSEDSADKDRLGFKPVEDTYSSDNFEAEEVYTPEVPSNPVESPSLNDDLGADMERNFAEQKKIVGYVEPEPTPEELEKRITKKKLTTLMEQYEVEGLGSRAFEKTPLPEVQFEKERVQVGYITEDKMLTIMAPVDLPRIDVSVTGADGLRLGGTVLLSDGSGNFSLYGLNPGSYAVNLSYREKTWNKRITVK